MQKQSSDSLQHLLEKLQSKAFPARRDAATALTALTLSPSTYPNVEPARLAEFEAAIKNAAKMAIDPQLMKQSMSLKALAPGYAGLGACLFLLVIGVYPGAILWAAATLWLLFWFFRTMSDAVKNQTAAARQTLAMGRELGVLR